MATTETQSQHFSPSGLTAKKPTLVAHVQSAWQSVIEYLALSIWIFGLVFWTVGFLVALGTLPNPYSFGFLAIQVSDTLGVVYSAHVRR